MKQKQKKLKGITLIFCMILHCLLIIYIPQSATEAREKTSVFQEQLNLEIDELFRPSRQKRFRSVISTPQALRKCATPLLKRARKYQELLNPENKFILYRPTDSWDPYYYDNAYISSYDSPGGHFRLYYTNDNRYGDAVKNINYVYQFAYYFDLAWVFIIDTLGYRPPIGEGEKVEVYIMEINYYGMTCYDGDNRGLYIIVNNDYGWARDNLEEYGKEIGAMKVTSVHEFFHVVQAGYDNWHKDNTNENMWWEENTAVWIEDELHDKVNDYLGYLGWPYIDEDDDGQWDGGEAYFDIRKNISHWGRQKKWFDYPHLSLDCIGSNNDYYAFEYGGVVWAKFLSENFGRAMIKTVFEQFPPLAQPYSYSALEAIEGAIEEVGQEPDNLSETFIQFKLANLLRHGYEEGNNYPLPFHEDSIRDYPRTILDNLSYLSAKYFAFHKPPSGGQTIRISFEGGNSAMALLAVPADAVDSGNCDPNVAPFCAIQRIPLDYEQGEYYFSFSENLSYSKLIIIPINLGWNWSASYSLLAEQCEESSLPPVPQIVHSFSEIRNQQPIVHLGWQRVQDVDQFQIWRGLKGNYQSLIFQSAYGDTNSYEDSDPDVFYPGQTYFYQIKFINAAGCSSSEIIELQTPEMSPYLFNLLTRYETTQGFFVIEVSFTITGDGITEQDLEYQFERKIKGTVDPSILLDPSKVEVESPDGDIVHIVYSDNYNLLQCTEYIYSITVSDTTTGKQVQKEVTVKLPNNPPLINQIGNKTVKEGKLLQFIITATYPDEGVLIYSISDLPSGASFDPNTQEFNWKPNYNQDGSYEVTFIVTDNGLPPLTDEETIAITVQNVNRPPELAPTGNRTVDEGKLLQFIITATDPDEGVLIYSISDLPSGANFDPNTQEFSWKPNYNQAGSYDVTFIVSDNGLPPLTDSETITIKVINKPAPSSNDGYYGNGWYSGGYSQGYQNWNVTNYQQHLWNEQPLTNWRQPQLEQFRLTSSQPWQQQQTWVKPSDLQSYTPFISQLQQQYQQQQFFNPQSYQQLYYPVSRFTNVGTYAHYYNYSWITTDYSQF